MSLLFTLINNLWKTVKILYFYFFQIFPLLIISVFLFIVLIFGFQNNKNLYNVIYPNKININEQNNNENINKYKSKYIRQIPNDNYDRITKETTKIELEKLYTNPNFISMLNEKGNQKSEWVWQIKEKYGFNSDVSETLNSM